MRRTRAGSGASAALAALVVVVGLGGCGSSAAGPSAGAAVALPSLPRSESLAAAAAERAEEMCEAGASAPPGPVRDKYRGESWTAVAEMTGRAPLDEGGPGPAAARSTVESGWSGEPALGQRWDRRADAEVPCDDGQLAVVTVLARVPRPSDAGPFARSRHLASQLEHREGVRYGRATDVRGREVDLLLDLDLPPDGTARPVIVLVHGGGFAAGSREMHADDARAYARRGFVVASIDYRLDPDAGASADAHRAASYAAIDDGRTAVRWLRSQADELGIDPDRIAVLGASAGGEVALGLAVLEPPSAGNGGSTASAEVAAAVSTGAYLTPVLGVARLDADDAPVLLHFYERDTASGRSWTYAAATCEALRAAAGTCDLEVGVGTGHTVGLGPDGEVADRIIAFLAAHLDLAAGP